MSEEKSLAELLREKSEGRTTKTTTVKRRSDQPRGTAALRRQMQNLPTSSKTITRQTQDISLNDLDLETYGLRVDQFANVTIAPQLGSTTGQGAIQWFMKQSLSDPAGYRNFDALLKAAGFKGTTPEARFGQAVAYAQQTGTDVFNVVQVRALEGYGVEEEKGPKVNVNNIIRSIQRSAVQRGIKLTKEQEKNLVNRAISEEWDAATLQENIARVGSIGEGGESSKIIDGLRQYATAFGIEYNPNWYENAANLILGGKANIEEFQNNIKELSKSKYITFADLIDKGMSPSDIASPYMQILANTLEIDPSLINLNNPIINQALTRINEEGKPQPLSIRDFEINIKSDRSLGYSKTKQGQQDYLSTGLRFLEDMTGGFSV
jgi:hypothetical protein